MIYWFIVCTIQAHGLNVIWTWVLNELKYCHLLHRMAQKLFTLHCFPEEDDNISTSLNQSQRFTSQCNQQQFLNIKNINSVSQKSLTAPLRDMVVTKMMRTWCVQEKALIFSPISYYYFFISLSLSRLCTIECR